MNAEILWMNEFAQQMPPPGMLNRETTASSDVASPITLKKSVLVNIPSRCHPLKM
jgi:hypothetical protein